MDSWGPEETRRFAAGLPVKTYVQGPGIMFGESYGGRTRPLSASADWATAGPHSHSRKQSARKRQERSRASFINLLSHYDKTGRLLVPSFSKEVAFEASSAGFNATARPSTLYPPLDDSPGAVADRIAWATAHRYLSEYIDKYTETANMAATARQTASLARGRPMTATAHYLQPQAAERQRPASAATVRGGRPESTSAMATRHVHGSRPATAAVHTSRPSSRQAAAAEALANETFPKEWTNVTAADLGRTRPTAAETLGQHVVPGSLNAKLIGGRHRIVTRPAEGDPQYTDYYGPVGGGPESHTYYGRKYTQRPGGVILRAPQ